MIVHDLRQPLTAISGYLQLFELQDFEGFTEKQITIIKNIINAVKLLMEMISSLLDISKLEAGKMTLNRTLCNMGEIFRKAIINLGPPVERYSLSVGFTPKMFCFDATGILCGGLLQTSLGTLSSSRPVAEASRSPL